MSRFAVIPHFLFDDTRVGHHLIGVYGALALFSDADGYCWPSLDTLAGKLRLSRASVSRYVAELVELGYVQRTRRPDTSCSYFLGVQRSVFQGETVAPVQPALTPVQPAVAPVETNNTKNNTNEQTRGRASRLTDAWKPSPELIAWAMATHPAVDVDRETIKFKNYWIAKPDPGARKLDWDRTWQTWILNAEKDYGGQQGRASSHAVVDRTQRASAERRAKIRAALDLLARRAPDLGN